jgi:hypothetical protein
MKRPVDIVRKDGTTTIRYGMRKDGDVNYLVAMDFHMTAYPSRAPEFTPVFSGVRVTRSLVLYVCFVGHCLSALEG